MGAGGAVVVFNKSVLIENSELVRLSGSGLLDTAGFMTGSCNLSSNIHHNFISTTADFKQTICCTA